MGGVNSYISIVDRVMANLEPKYKLTGEEKEEFYSLVSKAFGKVPEIPIKGDPETLRSKLMEFRECCNKFYGEIGARPISKTGTNVLIEVETRKLNKFVNSGSYEEPDYGSLFENISIFIAAETYNYYRNLKKK